MRHARAHAPLALRRCFGFVLGVAVVHGCLLQGCSLLAPLPEPQSPGAEEGGASTGKGSVRGDSRPRSTADDAGAELDGCVVPKGWDCNPAMKCGCAAGERCEVVQSGAICTPVGSSLEPDASVTRPPPDASVSSDAGTSRDAAITGAAGATSMNTPPADCGPIAEPTPWSGGAVWTTSQLNGCVTLCGGTSNSCTETRCDGGKEFLRCIRSSISACVGGMSGACRAQYVALQCCMAKQCPGTATPETCIEQSCTAEGETFDNCWNDEPCAMGATASCVSLL